MKKRNDIFFLAKSVQNNKLSVVIFSKYVISDALKICKIFFLQKCYVHFNKKKIKMKNQHLE